MIISRAVLAVGCLATLSAAACSSSGSSAPSNCQNTNYGKLQARVGTSSTYALISEKKHLTRKLTVATVTRDGCDVRVAITDALTGRPPKQVTYLVHPDGSIRDPARTIDLAHGAELHLPGATIPERSVLEAGTPVREQSTVQVTEGPRHKSVPQTVVVQGHRPTTTHVPAGTYASLPVTIDRQFTIGHARFDLRSTEYVAHGVGTVKAVEIDRIADHRLKAVLELIKLVRGGVPSLI